MWCKGFKYITTMSLLMSELTKPEIDKDRNIAFQIRTSHYFSDMFPSIYEDFIEVKEKFYEAIELGFTDNYFYKIYECQKMPFNYNGNTYPTKKYFVSFLKESKIKEAPLLMHPEDNVEEISKTCIKSVLEPAKGKWKLLEILKEEHQPIIEIITDYLAATVISFKHVDKMLSGFGLLIFFGDLFLTIFPGKDIRPINQGYLKPIYLKLLRKIDEQRAKPITENYDLRNTLFGFDIVNEMFYLDGLDRRERERQNFWEKINQELKARDYLVNDELSKDLALKVLEADEKDFATLMPELEKEVTDPSYTLSFASHYKQDLEDYPFVCEE